MASAQSSSLRSAPGYAARPASTPTFPTYPTPGALPAVPALAQDASLPGYASRNLIAQQLAQLGTQQNNSFSMARANTQQQLAGYGGWKFLSDDPSTAQREDMLPQFDPKAGPGEREKGAIRGARDNANQAGMLESSFANQNIASAVQRVSLEAQAIINQYASTVNQIATDFSNRGADLATQYAGLYGSDAAWAVEHPPPTPVPPVEPTPPPPEDRGGYEPGPGGGWTPPVGSRIEIVNNPPASAIAALKKKGYKKAGGPGNRWVLKY